MLLEAQTVCRKLENSLKKLLFPYVFSFEGVEMLILHLPFHFVLSFGISTTGIVFVFFPFLEAMTDTLFS